MYMKIYIEARLSSTKQNRYMNNAFVLKLTSSSYIFLHFMTCKVMKSNKILT